MTASLIFEFFAALGVVLLLVWFYSRPLKRPRDWDESQRLTDAVTAAHNEYLRKQ